jgi:adenosylcobinamide-phosphate synthase
MYRVAEYLAHAWTEPEHMKNEEFGVYAAKYSIGSIGFLRV